MQQVSSINEVTSGRAGIFNGPKLEQNLGKESTPNKVEIECRGV
jgi:hypothetical protein